MGGVLGELGATGVETGLVAGTAVPPACGAGLLVIAGEEGVAADAPVAGSTTPMIGGGSEGPPWRAATALPLVVAWPWGMDAGVPPRAPEARGWALAAAPTLPAAPFGPTHSNKA